MSQLGLEQKYESKQLSVKIGDLDGNFDIIDLIERDCMPEHLKKLSQKSRNSITYNRQLSRKTIRAAKTPCNQQHVHFSDDIQYSFIQQGTITLIRDSVETRRVRNKNLSLSPKPILKKQN